MGFLSGFGGVVSTQIGTDKSTEIKHQMINIPAAVHLWHSGLWSCPSRYIYRSGSSETGIRCGSGGLKPKTLQQRSRIRSGNSYPEGENFIELKLSSEKSS